MEVQVPQTQDIIGLVTADLTAFQASLGLFRPRGVPFGRALAVQALGLHIAPDRGIGRQGLQGGPFRRQGHQVVVVQLYGPSRPALILGLQGLEHRTGELAVAPGILTAPAAQGRHRVTRAAGGVKPALQGGRTEADRCPTHRVTPALPGQLLQGFAQFPARWRRRQQGPDDRKTQSRPAVRVSIICHGPAPGCIVQLGVYATSTAAFDHIVCGAISFRTDPDQVVVTLRIKCSNWHSRRARLAPV